MKGRIAKWLDRRRKYKNALAFNKIHTFTNQYSWSSGKWMCPTCNTVHVSSGWNPFTGSEYPDCCNIACVHRCIYKEHATNI